MMRRSSGFFSEFFFSVLNRPWEGWTDSIHRTTLEEGLLDNGTSVSGLLGCLKLNVIYLVVLVL